MGRRTLAALGVLSLVIGGMTVGASVAVADTLPTVTAGDVTVVEGDSLTAIVKVPVDLSQPAAVTTTVRFAVVSDSATGGSDFAAKTGKVTFQVGVASMQAQVAVNGDTAPEPDEHLKVVLSSPVNATIVGDPGGITIIDDDTDGVATAIEASVGEITVTEADGGTHYAFIPLTLSRPAPSKIVVHFDVNCASATAGEDYAILSSGNVAFAAGTRSKSVKIQVLADVDPETFRENIADSIRVASGPAVITDTNSDSEIIDDDGGVAPPPAAAPVWLGHIERVGVGDDEQEAETFTTCDLGTRGGSSSSEISGDGRYALFTSVSSNLVVGDTNELADVFVRDRVNGTTTLISVPPAGGQFFSTNLWAGGATAQGMSDDGRYVLFTSGAYSGNHLLVRDRLAGTTEDLGYSTAGSISDDGMRIAAMHYENSSSVVTLIDRTAGTTTVVARRSPEYVAPWQRNWGTPKISGNGRYVAFTDGSATVVSGDTNACADTFVYDADTHSYERVSVTDNEAQQASTSEITQCSYGTPTISADGRLVTFNSAGWNLYPGATSSADLGGVNGAAPALHAYARDRANGTTRLLDTEDAARDTAYVLAVSDNDRYAFYSCRCGEPLPAYPYIDDYVSIRLDLVTGETRAIGVADDGTWPVNDENGYFTFTAVTDVSDDGLVSLFVSWATNLAVQDLNGLSDSFVEDLR